MRYKVLNYMNYININSFIEDISTFLKLFVIQKQKFHMSYNFF